ncbi:hypothetical protein [Methanococcoides sp. FTZ1]|uniref:hypothetical protein n=1 Tax=Methanococcoides sp. FTZ1 TaxID=3439061 RepID=UPI003F85930A
MVDLNTLPPETDLYFIRKKINEIIDAVENLALDQETLQNNMEYLLKQIKSIKKLN